MAEIEKLFKPKSVAIIGVSTDKKKIGSVVFNNLKSISFEGKIFPVNPKYEDIDGLKCYSKLEEIQDEIDVVCICIPRDFVKDALISCVKKNAKFVIIISAGYSEIGKEGKLLEEDLTEIIKNSNTRIIGPNCLGIISTIGKSNLSFASSNPSIGDIAFISQSGAVCTAILDMAITQNLGFNYFVSLGNKVDITEKELIEYFILDQNTKVIASYLEEVTNDRNFFEAYKSLQIKKPFIILKPGSSKEAKTAMLSHTGSIANDDIVFETAMNKYGIITVNSIELLYNLMRGFSWGKKILGNRAVIVTNAGGPGIIATDELIENGLVLSKLDEATKDNLEQILPKSSNINNPIDLLGDANAQRYRESLNILANDSNVDIIFVLLTPQFVTEIDKTTEILIDISSNSDKMIVPIYLGDSSMYKSRELFDKAKIPSYYEIDEAVAVISKIYQFSKKGIKGNSNVVSNTSLIHSNGRYFNEVNELAGHESKAMPDELIEKIVSEFEIPLPSQKLCKNIHEAINFAKDKYPVVIKAPNSVIAHKSFGIKAIYVNIKNEQELSEKYIELSNTIKSNFNISDSVILLQKQMKFTEELILGLKRDGDSKVYETGLGFGHLMLFGKGGIYSEVYKDFGFGLLHLSIDDIAEMISKTKVANILLKGSGQRSLALTPLLTTIQKLQKIAYAYPQIDSLDINPLFIDEEMVCAVDVKISISK